MIRSFVRRSLGDDIEWSVRGGQPGVGRISAEAGRELSGYQNLSFRDTLQGVPEPRTPAFPICSWSCVHRFRAHGLRPRPGMTRILIFLPSLAAPSAPLF